MSDEVAAPVEQKAPETSETNAPAAASSDAAAAAPADAKSGDAQPAADEKDNKPAAAASETKSTADEEKPAADSDVEMKDATDAEVKAPEAADKSEEPQTESQADADKPAEKEKSPVDAVMTEDKPAAEDKSAEAVDDSTPAPATTPANKNRRKSAVASTGKKLNKKQSKAKIQHLDAQPGDHFFARLKGFPPWPVIVCDEEMLPQNMLTSRPVTAARPDGTYRDDYADGGKKVGDRTYPVMYLQTNEFSWTRNTDLDDLDFDAVADLVTPKMRKDLAAAHQLAAEQNSIDDYKRVLTEFQEAKLAEQEAKAARARAKKEKATKKSEPKIEDDDVDMPDASAQESEGSEKKKATKKRKAEEENAVPQRSDSVKKPKIKLTSSSTPKAVTNGAQEPKESAAKPPKAKSSKSKPAKDADGEKPKKSPAPKEPELTPEEKQDRKKKEILFLRHRLQKGLIPREGPIKESDMQSMSDFLVKLEGFPDLEASIIRVTKINKVLKAILKIPEIPKESEHNFKSRSQVLLDKWNSILAADPLPAESAAANGVNGTSGEGAKESQEPTNGVNGDSAAAKETKEEKSEAREESQDAPKTEGKADSPAVEDKLAEEKKPSAEPSAVESAA